jgi:NAD+ kinase
MAYFKLQVPVDARNTAWVCFDGKKRQQLMRGDSVRIRMSEHPMPTVRLHLACLLNKLLV